MKVNIDDVYEVRYLAIECPNCEEQIELDEKRECKVVCPFCNEEVDVARGDKL